MATCVLHIWGMCETHVALVISTSPCLPSALIHAYIHSFSWLSFRCVLVNAGKVLQLSRDHKPDVDSETRRIKKAGGNVTTHRVSLGTRMYLNACI